jgi:hypothetical protein
VTTWTRANVYKYTNRTTPLVEVLQLVYLLTQPQRWPPTCPRTETGAHLGLREDAIEELMQAISEPG